MRKLDAFAMKARKPVVQNGASSSPPKRMVGVGGGGGGKRDKIIDQNLFQN